MLAACMPSHPPLGGGMCRKLRDWDEQVGVYEWRADVLCGQSEYDGDQAEEAVCTGHSRPNQTFNWEFAAPA